MRNFSSHQQLLHNRRRFIAMVRKGRIVIPGRAHHLVLRGNNRRTLFSYATDYRKLIGHVSKALEPETCRLHALTLMTNHIHCLVTPASHDDLALFVKAFAQRYSTYRNRRRGSSGKLFQERYFSNPIEDPSYFATAQIYIDINAWRAGKVVDPFAHVWSTFAIHAGRPHLSRIPVELWTPSSWYLGLERTPEARAKRYLELVEQFYGSKTRIVSDEHIDAAERLSAVPSRMRIERPDRSSAR